MKNTPRNTYFDIPTHMIPLTNISYGILTPIVIRGHLRSLEVKKRSNFKNALSDTIFGIHTHMISLTNIGYGILN